MMNCLILDDEQPALELLEDSISKVPFLRLVGVSRDPLQVLKILHETAIDLMFLDIQMAGLNGLELLRTIQNPPLVIMVTAYEEYALESFNLDVVDYLVKPVAFPRFLKATQKAYELFSIRNKQQLPPKHYEQEYFYVNAGYSLVKVSLNEITYIEGLKDYVKINLTQGRNLITRIGMKNIEDKLPSQLFMRVHRSYIVAIGRIDSIQKTKIVVDGQEIPVSDGFRQTLQNHINNKNL